MEAVETSVEELNERVDRLVLQLQCLNRDLDICDRIEKLLVSVGPLSEEQLHAARVLVGIPSSKDYAVIT